MSIIRWTTALDEHDALAQPVACENCQADLAGYHVHDNCPGCGHSILKSLAANSGKLDPDGHIAIDIGCISCGYNLRTQSPAGNCPECNARIAPALDRTHLYERDPAWLKKLATGARRLAIAPLALVAVGLIMGCAAAFTTTTGGVEVILLTIVGMAVNITLAIAALVGVFMVTAPDPIAELERRRWSARAVTRWGFGIGLALTAAQFAIILILATSNFGGMAPFAAAGWLMISTFGIGGAAGVALTIGAMALVRHLRGLMLLVPHKALARFASVEFWLMAVTLVSYPIFLYGAVWTARTGFAAAAGAGMTTLTLAAPPAPSPAGGGALANPPTPGGPTFTHLLESDPNVTVTRDPDGTKHLQHPNGITTTITADGSTFTFDAALTGNLQTLKLPDGTTTTMYSSFAPAGAAAGPGFGVMMLFGILSWAFGCFSIIAGIGLIILLIIVAGVLRSTVEKAEQLDEGSAVAAA